MFTDWQQKLKRNREEFLNRPQHYRCEQSPGPRLDREAIFGDGLSIQRKQTSKSACSDSIYQSKEFTWTGG